MKLRRGLSLALPAVLVGGCLLPSFEVDDSLGAGGASGSAGTGGSATTGGNAGMTSAAGGAGGAEGGAGGQPEPVVMTADDEYVVVQEAELTDDAPGVLANDEDGLTVDMVDDLETALPSAFRATFDIAANGELTFQPAPGFFGTYRLRYHVSNGSTQSGTATVTIHVQPVDVELAAVAANVGGFCLTGQTGEGVGNAVNGAGDIDGDGFDDLLVGAPGADSSAGAVYVVHGSSASSSFELAPLSAGSQEARYFVLTGQAGSLLGSAVAPLGDVVGDTNGDFMVGAPSGDGTVYAVEGSDTYGGSYPIGTIQPIAFTGGASDAAGRYLASGFDVTGDSAGDPLIIVTYASQSNSGRFYTLDGAMLQAGTLATEAAAAFAGSAASDNLSLGAAHVGDVDDDGDNDLLVATSKVIALVRGPTSNFPTDLTNANFMAGNGWKFARASGASDPVSVTGAGDFDGDGVRDIAYCEGTLDCLVVFGPPTALDTGLSIADLAGPAWVSGGVDLAGPFGSTSDGAAELIVAQRDATANGDADKLFVLFGGGGTKTGSISATTLGDKGFTITAASGSDLKSIAPVGDVNGDDWQDFAVGDAGNEQVCIVFGGPYLR